MQFRETSGTELDFHSAAVVTNCTSATKEAQAFGRVSISALPANG
jgi:hypothetical protein